MVEEVDIPEINKKSKSSFRDLLEMRETQSSSLLSSLNNKDSDSNGLIIKQKTTENSLLSKISKK